MNEGKLSIDEGGRNVKSEHSVHENGEAWGTGGNGGGSGGVVKHTEVGKGAVAADDDDDGDDDF